jgi:site-specific recombinase XerC
MLSHSRKKVRSVLMSFFKWAQAEFKVHGNPVVPIRSPRLRDVEGELTAIRYRDLGLGRRRLRVHGKGGKIRHTPIPTEELRQELADLSLRRDPQEHLLYSQKRGPKGR